jgi:glycosyltransferase involved in cell wall biosynthesis
VLSTGFKERLIARGVPQHKVSVIYNWCDEDAVRANTDAHPPIAFSGRFNIVFAGTMGKAQALEAVLDAASIVGSRNANVQFVFVGGGVEVDRLKEKSQAMQLDNTLFVPRVPMNEVGAILQAADVLLVHLRDDPLFSITIPSKTQAYFAVGKPVLMAVHGNAAMLVEEARAGVYAEPEHPQSIADAALQLASMPPHSLKAMGENGRKYYDEKLSLHAGVVQFDSIFQSLRHDG